jgi:hypothetical protein
MITYSFSIKKDRLPELQSFIRQHLPNTRFKGNPINLGNVFHIHLTMDVDDNNKLNELHNKWYDEDNKPKTKKSFWKNLFKLK